MLMQIKVGSRVKTNLSACSLGHSSSKRLVNAAGRIDSKGSSDAETNEVYAAAAQVHRTAAARFPYPSYRLYRRHGLAALNLIRNPAHPWFLWVLFGWGIAIVVHDLLLLIKSRPKREIPVRPSTPDKA